VPTTSVAAGRYPVGVTATLEKVTARIIEMLREGTKEEASLGVSDVVVKVGIKCRTTKTGRGNIGNS
jgi:hypothetical protein